MGCSPAVTPLQARRSDRDDALTSAAEMEGARNTQPSSSVQDEESSFLYAQGYGVPAEEYSFDSAFSAAFFPQPAWSSPMPHPSHSMAMPQHVDPLLTVSATASYGVHQGTQSDTSSQSPTSSLQGLYTRFNSDQLYTYHEHHYVGASSSSLSAAMLDTSALAGAPISSTSSSTYRMTQTSSSLTGAVPDFRTPVSAPGHSTSSLALEIPYIACRVVNPDRTICGHYILLRAKDKDNAVRAHIRDCHSGYMPCNKTKFHCPWDGGKCHRQPAHIEDVPLHIYHTHLNLMWACDKCSTALWRSPFALQRHRNKCRGLEPARCAGCYREFMSQASLNQHIAQSGCARGHD